jgi:surfeit locus 1 family protein
VWPSILTLAAFVVLIALGTWQIERKAWKEALIANLTARLDAAPISIPGRVYQQRDEFRRVTFKATFQKDAEALVYTVGSSLRPDTHGPGYWVFAPAQLTNGGIIVVNRGFVPEGRQDPSTRVQGQPSGVVDVIGVMRWPEAPGFFQPADDVAHNIFFGRDQNVMAAAKGWGPVAPFYVEQEAPSAEGGLPQVGRLQASLPNNHLQYALTWYGLAAVLVGVFGFWVRDRWARPLSTP